MKIATIEKLKFKNLQRRLKLPLWQAVGLLESLWKMAYRNAPAGDIGRLSNDEIAAAIEWEGNADDLVEALVETRWLDSDSVHRLLIHDWENECESWLRGNFEKHGRKFAAHTNRVTTNLDTTTKQPIEQATTKPSLPYPTIPSPPPPRHVAPLNQSAPDPEPLGPEWAAAAAKLSGCGMADATFACESAHLRGATPRDVLNLLEHWQRHPGAWSIGLLHSKVKMILPDSKPSWPPPDQAYQKQENKKKRESQTVSLEAARAKSLAEKQKNIEERKKLPPMLDQLKDSLRPHDPRPPLET
jgi:hypothetical protein